MHRRNLLSAIDRYATRYPEESRVVARFKALLQSHEDCFERDCLPGHITGSAWLVCPKRQNVLLTHHRKLNMWLQLGGHSDGEGNTPGVAIREAHEESGLAVHLLDNEIFDLDVHEILIFCDPYFNYSLEQFQDIIDAYNTWYNKKDIYFMVRVERMSRLSVTLAE